MNAAGVQAVRHRRRRGDAVERVTGPFEGLLATVVPRQLARLLVFELHGWYALLRLPVRWLFSAG